MATRQGPRSPLMMLQRGHSPFVWVSALLLQIMNCWCRSFQLDGFMQKTFLIQKSAKDNKNPCTCLQNEQRATLCHRYRFFFFKETFYIKTLTLFVWSVSSSDGAFPGCPFQSKTLSFLPCPRPLLSSVIEFPTIWSHLVDLLIRPHSNIIATKEIPGMSYLSWAPLYRIIIIDSDTLSYVSYIY